MLLRLRNLGWKSQPSFLFVSVFSFFTSWCFSASHAAESSDIESLLQDAERALVGGRPTSKSRAPKPAPTRELPKDVATEPTPPEVADPNLKLAPLDREGLQKVIAVDLESVRRERAPVYPLAVLSISAGVHRLGTTYRLTKDDDLFTPVDGGQLRGAYLTFRPVWELAFLNMGRWQLFFSPVAGAGLSMGDVVMRRQGVQNGQQGYSLRVFPIDVGAQVAVEYGGYGGLFFGYGGSLEVVHQMGLTASDSVTDVFTGDEAWVGLSGRLSRSFEVFVQWKQKGLGWLLNNPTIRGERVAAGISFSFSS